MTSLESLLIVKNVMKYLVVKVAFVDFMRFFVYIGKYSIVCVCMCVCVHFIYSRLVLNKKILV